MNFSVLLMANILLDIMLDILIFQLGMLICKNKNEKTLIFNGIMEKKILANLFSKISKCGFLVKGAIVSTHGNKYEDICKY